MTWERRLIDAVLRHRLVVLAAVLAVSGAASWFAAGVGFDADIEMWFLEDDPDLLTYHAFLERFEADEIAVLGIFTDDVFRPEVLAYVDRLSRQAEQVPNAHRVRSLTNVKVIEARGDFDVVIDRLVGELPKTAEAAKALRAKAMANRLVRENLLDEAGEATVIIVELDGANANFDGKIEMVDALRALIADPPPGIEVLMAGSPPIDEAFYRYSKQDFLVLVPASLLVVVLATFLLFRRIAAVLIPLSVVGLASIWVFGLMGAIGVDINVVSTSLVALILAVGVADSIHVVAEYYQELMSGLDREEALSGATAALLVPCFFTSATTAAGFLSLLVSDLAPIREFGWLAAAGVLCAFVLSMTLVPILLSLTPRPPESFVRGQREGRLSQLLVHLGRPTARARALVLGGSGLLLLVAAYTLTFIEVGANPLNYFKRDDPIRAQTERIDAALGGTATLEFLVKTPPGGLKEPATLRRLDALTTEIEALPGVSSALSILDSLKEAHQVMTDGLPASYKLPDSRPLAAQLYLTLESDQDFSSLVQGDYSVGRLTARARLSAAEALTKDARALEIRLQTTYHDEDLQVEATGFIKLMSDMETYLFKSQTESLMVAFAVITLMMFLLLRSVRLALFSLIPNFTPIVLGLAFMVPAGFALDPGTVMIGSMALGLVVDDTVHFLVRLRRNLGQAELAVAVARTMEQIGRPIIVTSLVLAAGFTVLGLGNFTPNIAFGLVSAVVIVLALLADLLILPAAILAIRPKISRAEASGAR